MPALLFCVYFRSLKSGSNTPSLSLVCRHRLPLCIGQSPLITFVSIAELSEGIPPGLMIYRKYV